MTIYNFSAGPAVLPKAVLLQAQAELPDWHDSGMSVMEMSHRGKEFMGIAQQAETDLRELLGIHASYKVLFLQGGASSQFAMVPMNLLRGKTSADYLNTGEWSKKAIKEAKRYGTVNVVASSEDRNFSYAPDFSAWKRDPAAAYLHYTPNETIHGVEFHDVPDVGGVPLIADMSSNVLSRPVDVSKFGVIYAGAQKNIGASGLVVMIVRDDLLARCPQDIPKIFNYAEHAANDSMLNTPNTFGWYLAGLVFEWLLEHGGVAAMAERNRAKADLLYGYIDSSDFYKNPVEKSARSWMNVPFTLPRAELDATFLAQADAAGLMALKGHRAVGGMRASIYNAMPLEGVRTLVDFMKDFAKRNG